MLTFGMLRIVVLCGFIFSLGIFAVFGTPNDQTEEIDYLLFLPNRSDQFVNSGQANLQLDEIANYLKNRNLAPGQVLVYGYAAFANVDINLLDLSRDRALFVKHELQRRGVSADLFSEPVAHGSVDLWGGNTSEEDRWPNRRVRIMIDGSFFVPVIPVVAPNVEPVNEIAELIEEPIIEEKTEPEPVFKFPWIWLLPLLLLPLLFFIVAKNRKKTANAPVPITEPVPAPIPIPVSYITNEMLVDLEEEIRRRAYDLYLQRNGENGDADSDWYAAVDQICPLYQADGYQTDIVDGHWQALKTLLEERRIKNKRNCG